MTGIIERLAACERRLGELDLEIKQVYAEVRKAGFPKHEFELAIVKSRQGKTPRKGGHVYFLRFPEKRLVKIGFTRFLRARISTLAGAANFQHLVGTIDGDRIAERVVHYQFRRSREHGEFFLWEPIAEQVSGLIARNSALLPEYMQ